MLKPEQTMDGVYPRILRINGDAAMEPDEFTIPFAKSKIKCPRCIRWITKAEKLLTDRPLVKHQDIPGICDHCWRKLAKIQKLVQVIQLAKEPEKIGAGAAALRAQLARATRINKDQTKEPKELKERPATPRTPTSPTRIISQRKEGKTKGEKLKEELITVKDKKSIAKDDSPSPKDKKSIAKDNILVKQKQLLSTTDAAKSIAHEEALRTKDKRSTDDKSITQEKVLKTKDKVSKATAQKEAQSTKDKGSKGRDDKAITQEEALKTKDKESKARDEKSITQVEVLKTKDKESKAQGEALRTKDKGSKSRDEKSITQVEVLKTKDKESKAIAQGEALRTKDKGSKSRDDKSMTQEEALKTKDKGFEAISQKEALKTKEKESKAIAQEEAPRTKDKELKSVAQEEALKTQDKKSKVTDEIPKRKEESPIAKDKKTKAKEEKPISPEKSLAAKEEKPEVKVQQLPPKSTSAEQIKALIAQHKLRIEKEKLEAENKKKQQKIDEQSLGLAEKRAREAALELEREAKAKVLPPKLVLPVSDSEDSVMDDAVPKGSVISDIIIGEKICKNIHQDKGVDLKTAEIISAQKLENPQKLVVDSETHDKGSFAGMEKPEKGAVVESKKTAKVTVEGSDKYEKTKRKSIQDSKVAKSPKSAIDPKQNKKEDRTIRYSLSDRTFIDKGWTILPLQKVVRKMNVYRMRPSKPEFNWFERNKNKVLAYDTGEMLAEVDEAGRGRWYYRSGALAMDYYDAEETNAGRRFVVYSSGAPDAHGRPRPRTVLATFDHAGNGIVFDHAGKPRLKYNQTEGVVLDREIGPVSHWQWHILNDPPVLQRVMIDTQLSRKDANIARLGPKGDPDTCQRDDQAMLSIELDNIVKEKLKKSSQKFKPFQIKMKALKINENFSLRVLDQTSVYLSYRDGSTNLKINIGMLLDHKEIVDTDTSEINDVSNKMEKLPAYTASISELQRAVARARLAARPEDRLSEINSVDALRAAISRPPRTPLFTCSASATHDTPELHEPCSCDLYWNPLC